MTNKIIIKANPVSLKHTVFVLTDDKTIEYKFTIAELPKGVITLAKQFQVNNIDLVGNDAFLMKVKNDIINNKYSNQTLEITINKSTKGE